LEFSTPSKRFNLALPGALLNEVFGGCEGEGLAIDIAPCGRSAGRPPSWTALRPLRHMEDTMRRNKLALFLHLV